MLQKGQSEEAGSVQGKEESPFCWAQRCFLYLCMWEAASRCRSPDTCSFQRPPWRSRQNTSTPPRPRTGTPPPAPPHWPHGGGGHRTPLYNSPDGTTYELLTTRFLSPLSKLLSALTCCYFAFTEGPKKLMSISIFCLSKEESCKSMGSGQNERNTLQYSTIAAYYVNLFLRLSEVFIKTEATHCFSSCFRRPVFDTHVPAIQEVTSWTTLNRRVALQQYIQKL